MNVGGAAGWSVASVQWRLDHSTKHRNESEEARKVTAGSNAG